jgi:hypothetical protein
MEMSQTTATKPHAIVADFSTPEALLAAIKGVREMGYSKLDACTPFPIHGIDDALGEKPSRLGFLVIFGGIFGFCAAILLQWWTGAVDYPLVIGGKPLFAFEFSIPIVFELTVLFAAFTAVFGMLALNGLPKFYHPMFNYSRMAGATNDRFLLVIDSSDPQFESERTAGLLSALGSEHTEVVEE